MTISDLTINEYHVDGDDRRGMPEVVIERRAQYDGPDLWAVKKLSFVMTKKGAWEYDCRPSSRTDAHLKRTRFKTPEEALKAYLKYNSDAQPKGK